MGYDSRFYRAVMVEECNRDYITTALAKGASSAQDHVRPHAQERHDPDHHPRDDHAPSSSAAPSCSIQLPHPRHGLHPHRESSPGPVKAALAMMGLIEESYRLPLVPITEQSKTKLRAVIAELGLLKETSHAAA